MFLGLLPKKNQRKGYMSARTVNVEKLQPRNPDCAAWCESFNCEECDAPELRGDRRFYNPPAPEFQLIDNPEEVEEEEE
jgi:hypothetical protein